MLKYVLFDIETTGLDYEKDEPIEIGLLFLDEKLRLLESYSSFIALPPNENQKRILKGDSWSEEALPAFEVHKIPTLEIIRAPGRLAVMEDILKITETLSKGNVHNPVLVTDNAIFDFNFLSKIWGDKGKLFDTFHYSVWDLNLYLLDHGIHVPSVHRALPDATANWVAWRIARTMEKR